MKEQLIKITASNSKGIFFLNAISTAVFLYAVSRPYAANWWLFSLGVFFLTGCLGVTVTFHRYFSHKSFKMSKVLEYLFSFFGAMGGTGSLIGWVALHRTHHMHSDRPGDPHSPSNGKLKVLLSQYNFVLNKWLVRDLISNRFHRALHMYYHLIILVWAMLWASLGLEWFIFVVAIPVFLQTWVSTLSNVFNHWLGYRNFETAEKSTNNAFVALISWGEGWHNNHHKNPSNWNFKVKWWELDISALVIRLIKTNSRQS